MAETKPIKCPACGHGMPVRFAIEPATKAHSKLTVNVAVNATDVDAIVAHVETHTSALG